MQKLKLKDYLQTMSHPSKIFNIEVIIGDLVFVGNDIKAKDKESALKIMSVMSGGEVTTDSEIIHLEEKMVH